MRLVAMLIAINISFCLLSMPMSILQIVYNFKDFQSNEVEFLEFLHATAELLQYLNHGSNFILYSLSGKTFRNETKKFFRDLCQIVKKLKNVPGFQPIYKLNKGVIACFYTIHLLKLYINCCRHPRRILVISCILFFLFFLKTISLIYFYTYRVIIQNSNRYGNYLLLSSF